MTTPEDKQPNPQIISGLAMTGGAGITLAMLALSIGVIDPTADSRVIGLAVLAGVLALTSAIVAWFFVVQPHKHFDDINVPQYTGHHHNAEHSDDH